MLDRLQTKLGFKEPNVLIEHLDTYFRLKHRLDALIPYTELLNSVTAARGSVTSYKLKKTLQEWCELKGYTLNPDEYKNAGGRIIRKHKPVGGRMVAAEFFYIKTKANVE